MIRVVPRWWETLLSGYRVHLLECRDQLLSSGLDTRSRQDVPLLEVVVQSLKP